MHYEKIGKIDDLFVDEDDNPEYVGVKMGFLGTRATLIPVDTSRRRSEGQSPPQEGGGAHAGSPGGSDGRSALGGHAPRRCGMVRPLRLRDPSSILMNTAVR